MNKIKKNYFVIINYIEYLYKFLIHIAMNLSNLETLKQNFSGEIITSENESYSALRNTFAHEGSPKIILRPRNSEDVSLAIKFARDNSLLLSIKSGGHGGAGFGTNKDGLVIDLSLLNQIEILDQKEGLVKIGSGARWGDVASVLEESKLGISSGDTKSVGVGGLTLGGGIGWMVRKYGLALDSLVAAEIVVADGRILRVSELENSDLFWAIRCGGGNFGVVTYFEFIAHPITRFFTDTFMYPPENISGGRDVVSPQRHTTITRRP